MYELIILTHLMQRPSHGYLIAKIINDIIGPYAKISSERLYPLLARLEKDGLIAIVREGIRLKAAGWGAEWKIMQTRVINILHHATEQWQLELAWASQLCDTEAAITL